MSPSIPCQLTLGPRPLSAVEIRAMDARMGTFAAGASTLFAAITRPARLVATATRKLRGAPAGAEPASSAHSQGAGAPAAILR